jgi:hypothetical protein
LGARVRLWRTQPADEAVGGPGGLQSPAKFLEWGIVMKVSPQATRGHLVLGGILVAVALACVIAGLLSGAGFLPLPIFFFGVWGGVELGRCLEHALTQAKV